MIDCLKSEWVKVRSMRAAAGALFAVLLLVPICGYLMWRGVRAYELLESAEQGAASLPALERMVLPVLQVFAGALGALAITSEFESGSIRASVAAVPKRLTLLSAKAAVVAVLVSATGLVVLGAIYLTVREIVGASILAKPEIIRMVESGPMMLSLILSTMVVGLIGFAFGSALRSSAAALGCIAILLFIVPTLAAYVPGAVGAHIAALALPNLAAQMAAYPTGGLLTPHEAMAVLFIYLVAPLCLAGALFCRSDL